MSDATADHAHGHHPAQAHHFESMEQQFESGKLGMWVFLATEILMFGGLFCAYAIYRGLNPDVFLFAHKALDTNMGAINTGVLLASSFTMAWGVLAISQGKQKLCLLMIALTFVGGCGFMGIKTKEYYDKWGHNFKPGTQNAFYNVGGTFTNDAGHGAEYIEEKAGHHVEGHADTHGDDHGDEHAVTGEHGEDHGTTEEHNAHVDDAHAVHSDSEAGHETGVEPNNKASHEQGKAAPVEDVHAAAADAHTTEVEPVPAIWPPKPIDHANIAPPTNAASSVMPNFTREAQDVAEVSAVESLYKGAAGEQGNVGHSHYPRLNQLDPLSQERTHIFFQIYFIMTGLHGLHVLIGMGVLLWVAWKVAPVAWRPFVTASAPLTVGLYFIIAGYLMGPVIWMLVFGGVCLVAAIAVVVRGLARLGDETPGDFSSEYYTPVEIGGLYWHLVDLIWIFLFPLLYLIH